MDKPVLVVMAAGMGSRYGGLKQVDPVGPNKQTLMEYSLYDAKRAGFEQVCFVISEAMEADFPRQIQEKMGGAIEARYAVQRLGDVPEGLCIPEGREKPWGTAHAVRACRGVFRAPFAAINADDYYGPGGMQAIYTFLAERARSGRHAMVGYELVKTLSMEGHVARGICQTDARGKLVRIRERTHVVWSSDGPLYREEEDCYHRLPDDAVASMNLWGFAPDFMDELDRRFTSFLKDEVPENPMRAEYFLPEVVGQLLREGRTEVDVLPCTERWYGMTYKSDRPIVEAAIARMTSEGLYPQKLW